MGVIHITEDGRWEEISSNSPINEQENKLGFTLEEQNAMNSIMRCYDAFLALPQEHPDKLRDIVDAIHRIQEKLALRVVRRLYPKGWPTYKKN